MHPVANALAAIRISLLAPPMLVPILPLASILGAVGKRLHTVPVHNAIIPAAVVFSQLVLTHGQIRPLAQPVRHAVPPMPSMHTAIRVEPLAVATRDAIPPRPNVLAAIRVEPLAVTVCHEVLHLATVYAAIVVLDLPDQGAG